MLLEIGRVRAARIEDEGVSRAVICSTESSGGARIPGTKCQARDSLETGLDSALLPFINDRLIVAAGLPHTLSIGIAAPGPEVLL